MTNKSQPKDKYASYCKEHLAEFKGQLSDEAYKTMTSWPAKTLIGLFILSSLLTYNETASSGNPFAVYTLFAYAFPIGLVVLYPSLTLIFSSLMKYNAIAIDLLCLSGLLGFCLSLDLVFLGVQSPEILQSNYDLLQGQIAFVLALATAFSFHTTLVFTLLRNLALSIVASIAIYLTDPYFFVQNRLPLVEGFFLGSIINLVFHNGIQTRFYLKSTDADIRQHLYNQLSKLVYPHQLERIKLGDELENTMPLKEGKAIINVFDVQRSSEIRHEKTQDFFMGVFQSFMQICMKGYEHNPLRSKAFRLKETGDGFISAVGYPFLPEDSRSLADSAVSTALLMFEAFNEEVERFDYSRPIKGAMGLAYNSVQGTFQSGGIRSYDLFGDALIQASKYEELRKQPHIWAIFQKTAKDMGLEDFNILIVQEVVYNSLSPSYRDIFSEISFDDDSIKANNFQMMYDNEAKYIYFHVLK